MTSYNVMPALLALVFFVVHVAVRCQQPLQPCCSVAIWLRTQEVGPSDARAPVSTLSAMPRTWFETTVVMAVFRAWATQAWRTRATYLAEVAEKYRTRLGKLVEQVVEKKRVGYNLWTAYKPGPGNLTYRILYWYGPERKFFRLWRYTRQMGLRFKRKEAMKRLRG